MTAPVHARIALASHDPSRWLGSPPLEPLNREILREAVAAGKIQWRKHVLQKLAERGIQQAGVREVLLSGERIRDYPEDRPFPSALFLGYVKANHFTSWSPATK